MHSTTYEKHSNKGLIIVLIVIIAILFLFILVMVVFPAIRCPTTFGFLIRSAFSSQGCVYAFPPPDNRFFRGFEQDKTFEAFREENRSHNNILAPSPERSPKPNALVIDAPFRISNNMIIKDSSQVFYVYTDTSNKLGNLLLTTDYNQSDLFTYHDLLWKFGRQKVVMREKNRKLFISPITDLKRMSEEEKKKSVYWIFEKGTIWDYEKQNALSVVNYIHIKDGRRRMIYFLTMIPKENIGQLESSWSFC